jgi:hypothetical protein
MYLQPADWGTQTHLLVFMARRPKDSNLGIYGSPAKGLQPKGFVARRPQVSNPSIYSPMAEGL